MSCLLRTYFVRLEKTIFLMIFRSLMLSNFKHRTIKKILYAGTGKVPDFKTNSKAFVHFEVLLPLVDGQNIKNFPEESENYKSIDSTKKCWPEGYGKPFELVFGKKFQLAILETCISTMLVNEVSRFDIDKSELFAYPITSKRLRNISHAEIDKSYNTEEHHHHCAASGPVRTGYQILDELIEKPRCLRFIIELISVQQPNDYHVDTWQLNNEQKMQSLENYRQKGNNFFSQKKFNEASIQYREALGIIENLLLCEKPGDQEWTELDKKNIPFYLNLCQCYIFQSMYYEATQTASEVLKRDEFNEKALYRRAKAQIGSWDLDLAEQDLKLLLDKHSNNTSLVQEQLSIIAKKRKEKSISEKIAYKAMINGLIS